jgi:hypothetical protein
MATTKEVTIHLKIPKRHYELLREFGKVEDRSVHYLAVKILTEALDKREESEHENLPEPVRS